VPPIKFPKEEWHAMVNFDLFKNLGQHCEAHA
jgi:hypothetical protein